ncbi:hypothetical protein HN873_064818 [Arachis hypogaea]
MKGSLDGDFSVLFYVQTRQAFGRTTTCVPHPVVDSLLPRSASRNGAIVGGTQNWMAPEVQVGPSESPPHYPPICDRTHRPNHLPTLHPQHDPAHHYQQDQ